MTLIPRGLMLIEVLAALVLLGSTVVTLLVAQSRSIEQLQVGRQRATAAHLAGELLARWELDDTDLSFGDEGVFEGQPGWSWRRTAEPVMPTGSIPMIRLTLEIARAVLESEPQVIAKYDWLEEVNDGATP